MTHVLVVHHDPDMADQECDLLRQAGFSVEQCSGPQYGPCPVLHSLPCAAVDTADVLVYDVWSTGDSESEQDLIELLRELHPDVPIVLTAPGLEFPWVEESGVHAVVPLVGALSSARLVGAIHEALETVHRPEPVFA